MEWETNMSSTEPTAPEDGHFVQNQHYKFDPPVQTNCASVVPNSPWVQKAFAEGWCLGYDKRVGGYLFQGKPVGESAEFVFVVEWGKGSERRISRPPTYVWSSEIARC